MDSKATSAHRGVMLWWILLVALAVWGVIATVRAVRVDGLRRQPTARIVRSGERA